MIWKLIMEVVKVPRAQAKSRDRAENAAPQVLAVQYAVQR